MGSTVCAAVAEAPDLELVAAVDPLHAGIDLHQLGIAGTQVQVAAKASALVDAGAEVVVDFTVAEASRENVRFCAEHDVHAVVGTTGFSEAELHEFADLFDKSGANAVIAPNFAIGAVLMMRFAELAAPYFDTAEIIELHHDQKADAPSGTAVLTAQRMAAVSKEWGDDPTTSSVAPGARGGRVDGIPVHSLRLRGLVAHQEVMLGTTGQTLSIRHDSYDRSSFMPGVLLAVRKVAEYPGLTIGLDQLLGLSAKRG
jgi:4-hydroxy-tetrahydrodipicolinate reductase